MNRNLFDSAQPATPRKLANVRRGSRNDRLRRKQQRTQEFLSANVQQQTRTFTLAKTLQCPKDTGESPGFGFPSSLLPTVILATTMPFTLICVTSGLLSFRSLPTRT